MGILVMSRKVTAIASESAVALTSKTGQPPVSLTSEESNGDRNSVKITKGTAFDTPQIIPPVTLK